jgi:protoporphyrinogen oxidase
MTTEKLTVAIIGAGPAGLTAGYKLSQMGVPVTILEADPDYLGGISRTARYKGFHFDIGGHRFFSKSREIEDLWTEILPNDMLQRPRSSRIYYGGLFFHYPLRAGEALLKLGLLESSRCILSYMVARLHPIVPARSFKDWVTNQFGARLFGIFFKTYTEKVWGMSCDEISADWAAQRIKGLSLWTAAINALSPRRPSENGRTIKTLIDSFRYPRKGPGMMWEACAARIREMQGTILMGLKVIELNWDNEAKSWKIICQSNEGEITQIHAVHVISSAPMRELVRAIRPFPSTQSLRAAESLRYRDFITVVLILKTPPSFNDNWIYIHDPNVKVGRVQNFSSWSPEMVPDPAMACFGLEYFCFEGDGLWSSSDPALIELATKELCQIGLATPGDVVDGCVVRQAKAYPVYDADYVGHVATIRDELDQNYPTLHLVGRNGMHKYNNQDHAMMTAILCVKNILAGRRIHDLWLVNEDAEYHEAGSAGQDAASGLRRIPSRLVDETRISPSLNVTDQID